MKPFKVLVNNTTYEVRPQYVDKRWFFILEVDHETIVFKPDHNGLTASSDKVEKRFLYRMATEIESYLQ